MRRRPGGDPTPAPEPTLCNPVRLYPEAVFTLEQARQALGLKRTTLKSEVRQHRLRVARRGGRYFTTGAWLLEWIHAGEVKKRPAAQQAANGVAARNQPPVLARILQDLPHLTSEKRQQVRRRLDELG